MTIKKADGRPLRLYGLTEAAEYMGVQKQPAQRALKAPGAPAPLAELRMGAVWDADEIEEWDATRKTRPSRRRPLDGRPVDEGAKGPAAPKGRAAPKGEAAPKGRAAPKGEAAPKGRAAPKGEAAPKGRAAPKGEAAPKGPAAPKGEAAPKGPAAGG